jgi:3-dehydroquinate dehydratase/shikimate dehydrogenase
MICAVISRTRHKMIQVEIQEAAKRGARLVEVRLDFLAKAPDFKRLLENKPCPLIATVRRTQDGGRWSGEESKRQMLIRQATVAGFDWVDVEMDVADEIRRFKDVKRIVSYHNLQGVPDDLEQLHERMCGQDPDVVKLAVTAKQPSDNLRVLQLIQNSPKPTVALCMGDLGFPSRLLGAKYGAPFTYAAFNRERILAPGMPSFDELHNNYFYDLINADTKVYGVIGDPVAHSLSPLIHNAAFRHVGVNAVYLPFRVPPGQLPGFLKDFDRIPVSGYSVTIPHKEAAKEMAVGKDLPVVAIKAANTLVRKDDGFAAFNTDYPAVRETLLAHLPPSEDGSPARLDVLTALILGAGGVARAAAYALFDAGAEVTVTGRSPERAQHLAAEIGCGSVVWEARHGTHCDLLVNCTPVGMYPHVDESPIHPSFLKPGLKVFDTIYTPENTLLIKEARTRGCHVITGTDMFVRQAALQFTLFTGQPAPFDLIRNRVKEALSPLHWRGQV